MRFPPVIRACVAASILLAAAITADACMAVGDLDIRIFRSPENPEHAVGYISAYDCAAMPTKTFCCLGIRFETNDAWRKAAIDVKKLRFVGAVSGKDEDGFLPTPRSSTRDSFQKELDGVWHGFWGIYRKQAKPEELMQIKVEFSVAPGTTDEQLRAAFANCFIGASEGLADGRIIEGKSDHKEIIKLASVKVYSHPKTDHK